VSTSPTAPKPLKRDSRLGKYFEYDLSKMVNSKGGFLVEDGKEVDEDSRVKERERERQRAMQNLEPRMPYFFFHFLEVLVTVISQQYIWIRT
jgi:DNA-repair protein complementing XP-A cells